MATIKNSLIFNHIQIYYYCKWVGWSDDDSTWETEDTAKTYYAEKVEEFENTSYELIEENSDEVVEEIITCEMRDDEVSLYNLDKVHRLKLILHFYRCTTSANGEDILTFTVLGSLKQL